MPHARRLMHHHRLNVFKIMKRLAVLLPLFAFHGSHTFSQSVPPLINYEGQSLGDDGAPLPTKNNTLSLQIFGAEAGETTAWGPQVFDGGSGHDRGPRIPMVQGTFKVMLGPVDTLDRSLANAFTPGPLVGDQPGQQPATLQPYNPATP